MSILIKGVELPEVTCGAQLIIYQGIDGKAIPEAYKLSAEDLIQLLPHDDLIDRGMVCEFIKAIWDFPEKLRLEFVLAQIQTLPTFIRAERRTE